MYSSTEKLIQELTTNGYTQVSELLNTTNENLFIGPNNLLDTDKIESAKIFTHLVYSIDELNELYDLGTGESNDAIVKKWTKSNKISLIKGLETNLNGKPISNHMIGIFKIGRNLTSHMHIVHGGAIASLIDEYFVKVVLPLTPLNFAVTANLNIKYLKPVKFDENQRTINVLLDCFIESIENNKKFKVRGSLCNLNGEKYCIGELLVVVPRDPL